MNILQKLQQGKEKLEQVKKLNDLEQSAEHLQKRLKEIRQISQTFSEQMRKIHLLKHCDIEVSVEENQIEQLLQYHEEVVKIVEADPTKLNQSKHYTNWRKKIQEITQRLKPASKQAWKGFVAEQVVPLPSEFLNAVEDLPGYENWVSKMRDLQQQYIRQKEEIPDSTQAFQQFVGLINKIKIVHAHLNPDDFPPKVLEFVKEATKNSYGELGAPYKLLTPEVVSWLRENNLLPKIRVVIR